MRAWALDAAAAPPTGAVGQRFHLVLPLDLPGSSVLASYDDGNLVAGLLAWTIIRPDWSTMEVIDVGGTTAGKGRRGRGAFNALAIVSRPDGLNLWMDNDVGLATLHSAYGVNERTPPEVAKAFLNSAQFELDGEVAALPDGAVTGCQVETDTLYDARFVGASLQTCWIAVRLSRVALTDKSGRVIRDWRSAEGEIVNFRPDAEAVVRLPAPEDIEAAYPVQAVRAGVAGKANLRCDMDQSGRLVGCRVLSEVPEGYGFAAAALRLAERMQGAPKSSAGAPLPSVVEFTLLFRRPIVELFGGDAAGETN